MNEQLGNRRTARQHRAVRNDWRRSVYLSRLKLWNFRRYGIHTVEIDLEHEALDLKFNDSLNLLVGENDCGKTTILDAIRYVLFTQSREYIRVTTDDFHLKPGKGETDRASKFRIECEFRGFTTDEAAPFLEWVGIEETVGGTDEYVLRVWMEANRKNDRVFSDVKAGQDNEGVQLPSAARDLLRVTYLKPLRDSDSELTPGRYSRLSQVLSSHALFADAGEGHKLVELLMKANDGVDEYFKNDPEGKVLLEELNRYLRDFFHRKEVHGADITVARNNLREILAKLSLQLDQANSGLGSQNILFMATELLLLKREDYLGLKLALIEEIEAHLHPQAQLRVIDYLQNTGGQFILTSHSPNLASKVHLRNLILVHGESAYSMGPDFTKLRSGDYDFLERFLDVTKANLFFAKGVILVEGDAENLLVPALAEVLDRPLHRYGVSIVNVGSTAFLRYSRVFLRKDEDEPMLDIPVAVITDLDVPEPEGPIDEMEEKALEAKREKLWNKKTERYSDGKVQAFVSPYWTLEFELGKSKLRCLVYRALLEAKAIKSNKDEHVSKAKAREIGAEVAEAVKEWKSKTRKEVARGICAELVAKRASKAVMAQCLAKLLIQGRRSNMEQLLRKSKDLSYLVEAIEHVTEKLPDVSSDS